MKYNIDHLEEYLEKMNRNLHQLLLIEMLILFQIFKKWWPASLYANVTKSRLTPFFGLQISISWTRYYISIYFRRKNLRLLGRSYNSILNNPKQIIAASPTSNLRVAIFLSDDSWVNAIIDAPKGLIIDRKEICGRSRWKTNPQN